MATCGLSISQMTRGLARWRGEEGWNVRERKKRRAQYSSAHTINVLSLFSLQGIYYIEMKKKTPKNKNARIVFDTINNPRSAAMRLMVYVLRVVLMSSDRRRRKTCELPYHRIVTATKGYETRFYNIFKTRINTTRLKKRATIHYDMD